MNQTNQSQTKVTVIDDAGVLMEEEADWIQSVATELSEKTAWNITAVVCEGDFQLSPTENAIQCIVDINSHSASLLANGEAKDYLDSTRIETIIEEAEKPIGQQDYTQSLYLMLLGAGKAYESGKTNQWQPTIWLIIAAATLCVAAIIKKFSKQNNKKK